MSDDATDTPAVDPNQTAADQRAAWYEEQKAQMTQDKGRALTLEEKNDLIIQAGKLYPGDSAYRAEGSPDVSVAAAYVSGLGSGIVENTERVAGKIGDAAGALANVADFGLAMLKPAVYVVAGLLLLYVVGQGFAYGRPAVKNIRGK